MKEHPSADPKCKHNPFAPMNGLIVEHHWAVGVRVRCKRCGKTAYVGKRGRVVPQREST